MNLSQRTGNPVGRATSSRWLRRTYWLFLASSFVAILIGAFHSYSRDAEQRLQAAIAEADVLDPGWRREELEARRAIIPDPENSFLLVRSLGRRLPKNWWLPNHYDLFRDLAATDQLNEAQISALRELTATYQEVLAGARKLADLPRGRFTFAWSPKDRPPDSSTLWEEMSITDSIARLLAQGAMLLAQESKLDEALAACRAAANCGRSLGDHPSDYAQWHRRDCIVRSLDMVERTLAQGEPRVDSMAAMQRLLEQEERHPWLLIALRGERAGWHAQFSDMEAGTARMQAAGGTIWPAQTTAPLARIIEFLGTPRCKVVHAARLHYLNESVEIAKLSLADPEKNLESVKKHQALIRCGIAMLALERYRNDHGRWPDSLAALVPIQLQTVPVDPFDGAPLRYGNHQGGVVISSLGAKGFHLWDVAKRRQRGSAKAGPGRPEEK